MTMSCVDCKMTQPPDQCALLTTAEPEVMKYNHTMSLSNSPIIGLLAETLDADC